MSSLIPLPFTNKEQISLMQSGDELIIRVGNARRNIALPHILVGSPVKEARFEQDKLKIWFEEQKARV